MDPRPVVVTRATPQWRLLLAAGIVALIAILLAVRLLARPWDRAGSAARPTVWQAITSGIQGDSVPSGCGAAGIRLSHGRRHSRRARAGRRSERRCPDIRDRRAPLGPSALGRACTGPARQHRRVHAARPERPRASGHRLRRRAACRGGSRGFAGPRSAPSTGSPPAGLGRGGSHDRGRDPRRPLRDPHAHRPAPGIAGDHRGVLPQGRDAHAERARHDERRGQHPDADPACRRGRPLQPVQPDRVQECVVDGGARSARVSRDARAH